MLNKIKKITYILILVLFLASCNLDKCKSDNAGLCELERVSNFEIEEDAKITVGVFNENYGDDFLSNWDTTFPDFKGLLTYKIVSIDDEDETLSNISDYDLLELKSENVPLYLDYLMPFDSSFSSILENEELYKFSSQINQDENYFMPFDVEGLLFAYNKTMLEDFGVDLIDEDGNGLPDAIDSFEKIAELAKIWRKENITYLNEDLDSIFSFPLNDQMAMIPFFQNSDYRLIQGVSAEMMDLDEKLLEALDTLEKLGTEKWRFDKSLDNDTVWNYDQVLIDQSAPFLLVGNWMYYEHYQTSKAYELVFTKLPTLNDAELATISSVSGFVLNKDTKYPNAANMVLKHIKSAEGTQVAINNGVIPLINSDLLKVEGFKIDENTKQQVSAYQYSEASPLQAFEQNPEIRGWDIFLEIDFRQQFRSVFLKEKSPELAESEIKAMISEWLSEKNIIIEGLNDIKEPLEKDNFDESGKDKDDELGKDN